MNLSVYRYVKETKAALTALRQRLGIPGREMDHLFPQPEGHGHNEYPQFTGTEEQAPGSAPDRLQHSSGIIWDEKPDTG